MYIISVLSFCIHSFSIFCIHIFELFLFHKHQTVAFFILSDNLCHLNSPFSLLTFNIITIDIHGANLATYFVLSTCLTYSVSFSLFSWNWLCSSMYLNHFVLFFVTWDLVTLFLLFSTYSRKFNCSHETKRCLLLGGKAMTNLDSILKNRDITLPTKVHIVQSYGFSSSYVWMWELDYKEGRPLKNWCFWTMVLEKTLESPLNYKEIQPVHPKGNQSWIFTGRTDAEAESLATWCKELTQWKRPRCWERLRAGGEGDNRGWDGWMASPSHWTWVWVSSGRWWRTAKPGVLQSMGSQRVRHNGLTTTKKSAKK